MKPARKPTPRIWYRSDEVRRIRRDLLRRSSPRLHMMLLVTVTGAAGLLASILMLRAGMETMWLRYLAAFGLAYLVFLFLLWVWLRWSDEDDGTDLPDLSGGSGDGGGGYSGGGGQFGGGGSSGSWDSLDAELPAGGGSGDSFGGDVLGSAGDALGSAEEAAIPLMLLLALLAAIAAMLGSAFILVSSAPELLAELLLDGALSVSLYRRLSGIDTRHWLETAVHRTARPFLLAALIVSGVGFGMALYAPEAHSLGEVVYHAQHPPAQQ
ncbi:MAG TPA: hypothetical protein VIU46_05985 [Gallionellaceae bacterium]